jgi:hypothetical protein
MARIFGTGASTALIRLAKNRAVPKAALFTLDGGMLPGNRFEITFNSMLGFTQPVYALIGRSK